MKNSIVIVLSSLIFCFSFINESPNEMIDEPVKLKKLMKEIYSVTESYKTAIILKKNIPNSKLDQSDILIAKTSKNKNPDHFKSVANNYLKQLSTLKKKQDKKSFNNMIDACLNCHEQYAKLWTRKINKLYIK